MNGYVTFSLSVSPTHVTQVEVSVGPEDNGKDGENNLQEGELEGAKFEQEESASRWQQRKLFHGHF